MGNISDSKFFKCNRNPTEEHEMNHNKSPRENSQNILNSYRHDGNLDKLNEKNLKEFFSINMDVLDNSNTTKIEVANQSDFSIIKGVFIQEEKEKTFLDNEEINKNMIQNDCDDPAIYDMNYSMVRAKSAMGKNDIHIFTFENSNQQSNQLNNSSNNSSFQENSPFPPTDNSIHNFPNFSSNNPKLMKNTKLLTKLVGAPLEIINEQNCEGNTSITPKDSLNLNTNRASTPVTERKLQGRETLNFSKTSKNKLINKSEDRKNKFNKSFITFGKNISKEKIKNKINKNQNDENDLLRNRDSTDKKVMIDSIKSINLGDNDVILQGELFKLSTDMKSKRSYDIKSYAYTSKFCVITKTHFKYYNSKESYLRLMNPNLIFPVSCITNTDFLKESYLQGIFIKKVNFKENGQIFHLYLKITGNNSTLNINDKLDLSINEKILGNINLNVTSNFGNNSSNNYNPTGDPFKKSLSSINNHNNLMDTLNITGTNFVFSKDIKSITPYTLKRKKSKEKFNNLLIFATNNSNHINMWLGVIQFLINKSN